MKSAKSTILLKRKTNYPSRDVKDWTLTLHEIDRLRVREELIHQFVKSDDAIEVELEMTIKSAFQFKTSSQLGYLHAEIWEQWYKYYHELGYATENKVIQEKIRNEVKLHDDVAFYERGLSEIDNDKVVIHVKSFSGASKEETSVIIERIIRLGNGIGIHFTTPKEWRKSRGIIEFTK